MFAVQGIKIDLPLPRMTYQEAKDLYGTDKPDLRFGLQLHDCREHAKEFSFSIFLDQLAQGGTIKVFVYLVEQIFLVSSLMFTQNLSSVTVLWAWFGLKTREWYRF